jgi:phospholipase/carboxylesterase
MNRMPLPTQASSQSLTPNFESDWLRESDFPAAATRPTVTAPHSLFTPVHYEPGYAYPLIVWLHGPTGNEQEVSKVLPLISLRNYVAVAPQGTVSVSGVRGAYGWGDSLDDLVEAGERVLHCIDAAQERFNIHPDRIFVAGYGEGGTMALRMGLENPDQFAGAISLGGPVPSGSCLLRRINEARDLPLLLSVSPNEQYPLDRVMENVRLLHLAGSSLALRLYPEGDELTTVMLSDVDSWIMERVCPAPSVVASK